MSQFFIPNVGNCERTVVQAHPGCSEHVSIECSSALSETNRHRHASYLYGALIFVSGVSCGVLGVLGMSAFVA